MKSIYYLLTAIASVAMIGCSQSGEGLIENTQPEQGKPTTDQSISANLESITRTSLNAAMKVVWTAGDQIRMFNETSPAGELYTTENNGTTTGIFTPVVEESVVSGGTRYAVYPASAAANATLNGSVMDVDFSGIAKQDYVDELTDNCKVANLPMAASSTSKTFNFINLCGGLILQLNEYQDLDVMVTSVTVTAGDNEQIAGKASYDAASGMLTLKKGNTGNAIEVTSAGVHIKSGGDMQASKGFVVFLPAATYEKGLMFTITDSEGRVYTKGTTQAVTIAAGTVTPLSTLPMTIYYGKENCYRVSTATTIDVDITPYCTFSDNYVRDGQKIVDRNGNVASVPVSASIVWQESDTSTSGDVVTSDLPISGTTLKVTTTGTNGNAVVAVKNAAGTILWSYHIWVSEVAEYALGGGQYQIMDRNLGATCTTPANANAYGVFYQWGRKDPLPRNLSATKPASSNKINGVGYASPFNTLMTSVDSSAETGTIAYAIQNPNVLIAFNGDWLANINNALWGNNSIYDNENTVFGVKTVYDPCPEGYRVPDFRHLDVIAQKNLAANGLGGIVPDKTACAELAGYNLLLDSDASYYSVGGLLNVSKGADGCMQYLEYRGYIWESCVASDKQGADMSWNNSSINAKQVNNKATGLPVRCVKM